MGEDDSLDLSHFPSTRLLRCQTPHHRPLQLKVEPCDDPVDPHQFWMPYRTPSWTLRLMERGRPPLYMFFHDHPDPMDGQRRTTVVHGFHDLPDPTTVTVENFIYIGVDLIVAFAFFDRFCEIADNEILPNSPQTTRW